MQLERFHQFFNRIKSEREEVRVELNGLPIKNSGCKVGDFGCGWGYITWCLMLEIPNSECIGIDKFDPDFPPEFEYPSRYEEGSVNSVQGRFREVIDIVKSGVVEPQGNDLISDIHRVIINEERHPLVRKGDIVAGENLSSHFDLIYCKRVLYNIYLGENNNPDRIEGVNRAITHIANALKSGGWFCFEEIEPFRQDPAIENILKQAGFIISSFRRVTRPYRAFIEYNEEYPYVIYHCNKL